MKKTTFFLKTHSRHVHTAYSVLYINVKQNSFNRLINLYNLLKLINQKIKIN